jgi:alanyl-tRNA synthetase
LRITGEIVSRALKIPVTETGKGVLTLLEKTNQLERNVKALEETIAQFKAEALVLHKDLLGKKGQGAVLVESIDTGIDEVLRIGRAAQKLTDAVLVLASLQDTKFAAFCSAKHVDIRSILKEPMEIQGGRGGGSQSFFQGLFPSEAALAAFLEVLSNESLPERL